MFSRLFLALTLVLSVGLIGLTSPASAQSKTYPPVYTADDGLALGGHDPVAYFTEGQPTMGDPAISLDWNGATWHFASAEHRDRFAADPEAWAPRFGGYCAWAASQGYIAPGDPRVWRIVEGRLYLNYNSRAQMLWEQDVSGAISKGEANWPRILTDNQG